MKQFLKLSSITLLFSLGIGSQLLQASAALTTAPVGASQNNSSTASQVSVHEMFKDVPQDELLAMMEEGQQFIKYLEENGTPEEKMAFAQAMEETLQGFSEDDWKEFEAIVETVQDKLPPLVIEPKEETPVQAEQTKESPKKEEVKAVVVDNSLEKVLQAIHKAINSIVIKTKSDKILAERMAIDWDKKDDFNEMARLLQVLNNPHHLAKLTSSKDEAIKLLVESIQNFNKRLQIENDQFVIADTFGLEIDEQTTAANLKKLNKILEFFESAIESLLPKLIKFLQEFEPEALKKAQQADELAKKSLENATKIEKLPKRHIGNAGYTDKAPSRGSQMSHSQGAGYGQGGTASAQQRPEGYLEGIHKANLKNIQHGKKSSADGSQGGNASDKFADKKEVKKSAYNNAIDTLEGYLESYSNAEIGQFSAVMSKTGNIYQAFGSNPDENAIKKAEQLQEKKRSATISQSEESFLQKHNEQVRLARANLSKNIEAAHSHYADLRDAIDSIVDHIDEMHNVLAGIKSSLDQMNSKELEQLNTSAALKNFGQRVHQYHTNVSNTRHELRNKHKLHRLEGNAYEVSAYNDLATKADSLHGLDKKISSAKSEFEALHKAIKSAIARHKRDENKAAAQR